MLIYIKKICWSYLWAYSTEFYQMKFQISAVPYPVKFAAVCLSDFLRVRSSDIGVAVVLLGNLLELLESLQFLHDRKRSVSKVEQVINLQ